MRLGNSLSDIIEANIESILYSTGRNEQTYSSHGQIHTENSNSQSQCTKYQIFQHQIFSTEEIADQCQTEEANYVPHVHQGYYEVKFKFLIVAAEVAELIGQRYHCGIGRNVWRSLLDWQGTDQLQTVFGRVVITTVIGILVKEVGNNEHETSRQISNQTPQSDSKFLILPH